LIKADPALLTSSKYMNKNITLPSATLLTTWVCNSWPAKLDYAVRGYICKLCIH